MLNINKKIKCCVFDWAGTTVDYGCRAPLNVFLKIFEHFGIPISVEEAAKPMGMLKIEHIRVLLGYERIKNEFFTKFNRYPNEQDVILFNELFEPELFKILPTYADPLPHVVDTVKKVIIKLNYESFFR